MRLFTVPGWHLLCMGGWRPRLGTTKPLGLWVLPACSSHHTVQGPGNTACASLDGPSSALRSPNLGGYKILGFPHALLFSSASWRCPAVFVLSQPGAEGGKSTAEQLLLHFLTCQGISKKFLSTTEQPHPAEPAWLLRSGGIYPRFCWTSPEAPAYFYHHMA